MSSAVLYMTEDIVEKYIY